MNGERTLAAQLGAIFNGSHIGVAQDRGPAGGESCGESFLLLAFSTLFDRSRPLGTRCQQCRCGAAFVEGAVFVHHPRTQTIRNSPTSGRFDLERLAAGSARKVPNVDRTGCAIPAKIRLSAQIYRFHTILHELGVGSLYSALGVSSVDQVPQILNSSNHPQIPQKRKLRKVVVSSTTYLNPPTLLGRG